MTLDVRVPKSCDGDTIQERTQNNPSPIYGEDDTHGPADDAHLLGWKDVEVLDDNRGFGSYHGGVVEWDADPKELKRICRGDFCSMQTHAVQDSYKQSSAWLC